MARNSASSVALAKKPKSETYIAPVANGVKRASSDRLISTRSIASGSIPASVSIVHSRNETPIVTMAATTWFVVSADTTRPSETSVLANSARPR